MKRSIVNMLAVFVLLLACTLGFAACGKKNETATLTNDDVVGVWYSTQVVVAGRSEGNGTYTYERYLELKAIDEGTERDLTSAEIIEYTSLKNVISNYKLTEDGKVYQKTIIAANYGDEEDATWQIVNNQVKVTTDAEDVSSITWSRNNNLAIVTVSFTNGSSCTYTLAKVVD